LVGRVGEVSARKASPGRQNAGQLAEVKFPPPETAAGQIDVCLSGGVFSRFIFLAGYKADRKTVDTVSGIFLCKALAVENMAQMATAIITKYLYPPPVGIANFFYCARYFIVKAGPATATAEFILTIVQGCITATADKDAIHLKVIILSGKRHFGTLTEDDALFFRRQGIVVLWRFHTVETLVYFRRFKYIPKRGMEVLSLLLFFHCTCGRAHLRKDDAKQVLVTFVSVLVQLFDNEVVAFHNGVGQ
jgi:hypothetical protein